MFKLTIPQQKIMTQLRKGWILKVDQSTQWVWIYKHRRIPIRVSKIVFLSLLRKYLLKRVPSNRIDVTWFTNI